MKINKCIVYTYFYKQLFLYITFSHDRNMACLNYNMVEKLIVC